jgi:hypothetical protein
MGVSWKDVVHRYTDLVKRYSTEVGRVEERRILQ